MSGLAPSFCLAGQASLCVVCGHHDCMRAGGRDRKRDREKRARIQLSAKIKTKRGIIDVTKSRTVRRKQRSKGSQSGGKLQHRKKTERFRLKFLSGFGVHFARESAGSTISTFMCLSLSSLSDVSPRVVYPFRLSYMPSRSAVLACTDPAMDSAVHVVESLSPHTECVCYQ